MSYTDGRDFECEYWITLDDVMYELEKSGGGTLGRTYEGTWRYQVTGLDGKVTFGQDLHTGTPKTHREAAYILRDFFTADES